jgi:ATP-dependent helicase HrpB
VHEPGTTDLPVEQIVDDLKAALDRRGVAVLSASPGAGKTTVVPLRLLDQPWLDGQRILMLEPRRLATRAAARRMASLLGEEVGDTVGYRTRTDRAVSPSTQIEVVTEGILTRRLQRDPELEGVGLVIFDEFHERSLQADLGLALTLDVRDALRSDLRVLVMSATLDIDRVSTLLGGEGPPTDVIEAPGRTHDVEIEWAPRTGRTGVEEATVAATQRALRRFDGDILVFLAGAAQIRRVVSDLERAAPADVDVRPLFGALTPTDQDAALLPCLPGRRKIVVATDIAESSLTVEGVRIVVDSGQRRVMRHDPRTGMGRLTTTSTSRASADQRAGRAGREAPGHAIRLWSPTEQATRSAFERPEITLADIAGFVLETACWGASPEDLRLLDQPDGVALAAARNLLGELGAIDEAGHVSAKGRAMGDLPLHPRLAAMVVDARNGPDAWTACIAAAVLEEGDVLRGRPDDLPVDLGLRVALVEDRQRSHPNVAGHAIAQVRRDARDLARRARVESGRADTDRLGAVLLSAYPDRLAQKRAGRGRFLLSSGQGAWLADTDALAGEALLVVADLDGTRGDARVRLAAGVDVDDVVAHLGDRIERRTMTAWDDQRGDVVSRSDEVLDALTLRSVGHAVDPSPAVVAILVDAVRGSDLRLLGWTERGRRLQARIELARTAGRLDVPAVDDDTLRMELDDWLAPLLHDATSVRYIARLDVTGALLGRIGWHHRAELDRLVPEQWTLPSGRTAAIDYTRERPTVSGRVQEFYGSSLAPAVLDGAVPLTVELLSPANRPVQVTSDLAGFWAGSWHEVRKDMAGRYPKHRWPKDPTTAEPGRSTR